MVQSDDRFKCNFHLVRWENYPERFTFAWFNQANTDVTIQGPEKKYPATTVRRRYIVKAMRKLCKT